MLRYLLALVAPPPDVKVRLTILGIGAGRDEVLEEALRQILGSTVPAGDIEKMAKPWSRLRCCRGL